MVGERIKERRKELGLSLRALGEKTNLSASFLSLVERGEASPSLSSLHRISKALDVPVFYLDGSDNQVNSIVANENRHRIFFPGSGIGYELLTPDLSRKMMFMMINLEPGSRRICEPLARPTEQWIYVLEGKLHVTIAGTHYELNTGDSIYFDGDMLQEFFASSSKKTSFINAVTPPAL